MLGTTAMDFGLNPSYELRLLYWLPPPPPPPPPPAAPPPEVDGPVPLRFVTGKLGFPFAPKACVPVVIVVFPPPGPGVAPAPPGA